MEKKKLINYSDNKETTKDRYKSESRYNLFKRMGLILLIMGSAILLFIGFKEKHDKSILLNKNYLDTIQLSLTAISIGVLLIAFNFKKRFYTFQLLFFTSLIFGLCAESNIELYGFYESFFIYLTGIYISAYIISKVLYYFSSEFWDEVDVIKSNTNMINDSHIKSSVYSLVPNIKKFSNSFRY